MSTEISKLKLIVLNKSNDQPLSKAKVYWDIIPAHIKNKNTYCKKYIDSEDGLLIDITNHAGFSLLWGELAGQKLCWIYVHKIMHKGFEDLNLRKKLSVKGSTEREYVIYLIPVDK